MNDAELILNPDGSVYHLNLRREDIAPTVILVGDPGRVAEVSGLFDTMDVIKSKREFLTHTGWYNNQRITVVGTGIGTDNIDIVINELDALVNIDLDSRKPIPDPVALNIIRIGTSGSINPEVHVDDIVVSGLAAGTDALGLYYRHQPINERLLPSWTYLTTRYPFNLSSFPLPFKEGITLTCPGFYGPQGRVIRAPLEYDIQIDQLHEIQVDGYPFVNLEMETSAIYLLSEILGHRAISFNHILAQRMHGHFSTNPAETMQKLIKSVLDWITSDGAY